MPDRQQTSDHLRVANTEPGWFRVRHEGREQALAFLDSVRNLMDPENIN
jgi:hypothetical protein